MRRSRRACVFTVLFVIGHHFQLASFQGFPVTIGFFAGIAIILNSGRWAVRNSTFFLAIATLAIAIVSATASNVPTAEFVRTFALLAFALAVVSLAPFSLYANDWWSGTDRGLWLSLLILSGLTVTQVLTGMLGSDFAYNPWRGFQYLYQHDPLLQFNAVPRAQAFYLEPSYAAFVINFIACVLLVRGQRVTAVIALCALNLLAIRSVAGLVVFAFLILLVLIRRASPRTWFMSAVAGAAASIFALPYLAGRFASLGTTGSSANYRIIAPLRVLEKAVNERPAGQPLGSVEQFLTPFRLANGEKIGTSIDNGFYLIVFYFGFVGVFGLAGLLVWAIRAAMRSRTHANSEEAPFLAGPFAFASLGFSGGIFLPEYALALYVVFAAVTSTQTISMRPDSEELGGGSTDATEHYRHYV